MKSFNWGRRRSLELDLGLGNARAGRACSACATARCQGELAGLALGSAPRLQTVRADNAGDESCD
jgi:hypothetical protein